MVACARTITLHADNRLISVLTQSSELRVAHEVCGLSIEQMMQGQMRAARVSFLPSEVKAPPSKVFRRGVISIDLL